MTAQQIYHLVMRIIAAWLICQGLIVGLSLVTGPFAMLIGGVLVLIYARSIAPPTSSPAAMEG
jgi:hypothetical protein